MKQLEEIKKPKDKDAKTPLKKPELDIKKLEPVKAVANPNTTLLDVLVKQSYATKEDIDKIPKDLDEDGQVDYLLSNKIITIDLLGQALAEYYKVQYYDLNSNIPDPKLVLKVPEEVAKKFYIVLVLENEKEITVATDDPTQGVNIIKSLAALFPNKKVKIVYSLVEDIEEQFKNYQKPLDTRVESIIEATTSTASDLVSEIINDGVEKRASDIHFEPLENEVVLRFRIDGVLKEESKFKKEVYEGILNRIKVLGKMRIDEHFAAQDGAMRLSVGSRSIDLRISIVPTLDGEKIVMRILSDYVKGYSLEDLGLSPSDKEMLITATKKTFGMILTTGPTGSGKTTTLYSLIKLLHKPEVNITTIEDPVEYKVSGINQIQVNNQTNLTFAKGLRSIVRQDPNVILVGEIRDNETAEIAVNAALTGHLLLSTFHANDASTAVPRLLDMGIEPFLLSSTLNLIIAQRLVRKICDNCRFSFEQSTKDLKEFLPDPVKYFGNKSVTLYKGKGCEKCNGSGYRGRIGIFELISMTPKLQELILRNESSQNISKLARSEGSHSFFDDGILKVKEGVLSLEELLRVAPVVNEN